MVKRFVLIVLGFWRRFIFIVFFFYMFLLFEVFLVLLKLVCLVLFIGDGLGEEFGVWKFFRRR